MRYMRMLMVVAAVAVLAACSDGGPGPGTGGGSADGGGGGGGGGGQTSSLPDPCALVTKAEVEAAVGGPVADGFEQPVGPNHYAFGEGRQCTFVPDSGIVSATWITVYLYSADGWAQYKTNQASYGAFKEVAGVGEEAVGVGDTQIGLHQAGYVLDVAVGLFVAQDPAGGPRVLALAQAAAGRLDS